MSFIGIIIVVTGFLALYWAFIGQGKYNDMFVPKRKTELKAVLFDLDGVLIDSFDAWCGAINELRKKYNLSLLTKDEYRKKAWAIPIGIVTKTYFPGKDPEKMTKECIDLVAKGLSDIKLLPGAKKVLSETKKKHKVGLVTNSYRGLVSKILKHYEIEKYFDVKVTSEDVEKPKPYPDSILKACEKLKVMPDETIYVGDTKHDYKAGKIAGSFVVGLNTDGDLVIDDLKALLDLV
jgi:HAD superfamily hydrolase (TIGR01509 family)